jgi:uncharacterized protein (TIGR02145 family)
MKKVFKIAFLLLIPVVPFAQSLYTKGQGVKDIDGNDYPSIIINGQEWMQKNLAVTKYRNGDPIPTGLDDTQWVSTTDGAYAIYDDEVSKNSTYGKLYNWYAVHDGRGICPTGWHVPSDVEWTTLINYLDPNASGGDSLPNVAGGKMKSTGTIQNRLGLWDSPNEQATNKSGFSGLPGGKRDDEPQMVFGTYLFVDNYAGWWSNTEYGVTSAWFRSLSYEYSYVFRGEDNKRNGFSVRCVRD